jgi:hypothetical protein
MRVPLKPPNLIQREPWAFWSQKNGRSGLRDVHPVRAFAGGWKRVTRSKGVAGVHGHRSRRVESSPGRDGWYRRP